MFIGQTYNTIYMKTRTQVVIRKGLRWQILPEGPFTLLWFSIYFCLFTMTSTLYTYIYLLLEVLSLHTSY